MSAHLDENIKAKLTNLLQQTSPVETNVINPQFNSHPVPTVVPTSSANIPLSDLQQLVQSFTPIQNLPVLPHSSSISWECHPLIWWIIGVLCGILFYLIWTCYKLTYNEDNNENGHNEHTSTQKSQSSPSNKNVQNQYEDYMI